MSCHHIAFIASDSAKMLQAISITYIWRSIVSFELALMYRAKSDTNFLISGFKNLDGTCVTYDVTGEAVFDEKTGEFIAGMTTFKDVTEYTEKLKTQSEENERQFEMICDTMPQLLWATPSDGLPDWFSKRWYSRRQIMHRFVLKSNF